MYKILVRSFCSMDCNGSHGEAVGVEIIEFDLFPEAEYALEIINSTRYVSGTRLYKVPNNDK